MRTALKLWLARVTLRGLRRERARLHQMQAGIEWEMARNTKDMARAQARIAHLEEYRRQEAFANRFAVRSGDE